MKIYRDHSYCLEIISLLILLPWDDLLYIFGPNRYLFKYVVYYSYYVYILFVLLLMNISLPDEMSDVCMMPL